MTETQERVSPTVSDERLHQLADETNHFVTAKMEMWKAGPMQSAEVIGIASELLALRAPAHPHVDDAMVERAMLAQPFGKLSVGECLLFGRGTPNPQAFVRAALLAALQVKP